MSSELGTTNRPSCKASKFKKVMQVQSAKATDEAFYRFPFINNQITCNIQSQQWLTLNTLLTHSSDAIIECTARHLTSTAGTKEPLEMLKIILKVNQETRKAHKTEFLL